MVAAGKGTSVTVIFKAHHLLRLSWLRRVYSKQLLHSSRFFKSIQLLDRLSAFVKEIWNSCRS
jgi:hypothetical protein